MKTPVRLFYIGQIVVATIFTIGIFAQTIRGLFSSTPAFINICFAVMTYTTYRLLYRPSIREYRDYQARYKKGKNEQNEQHND